MANDTNVQPFQQFLESIQSARHEHFIAKSGNKVTDEDSFAVMKTHVLKLYQGVEVQHSFADDNGTVFDCVPVEQQPSLKGSSAKVMHAPDLPRAETHAKPQHDKETLHIPSPLEKDHNDRQGNAMSCPEGTIPMRRITLQELTRFESLRHFLQKNPVGKANRPPRNSSHSTKPAIEASTPATHRWAHAYQNVNNLGGHSFLNVWDPPIGTSQIFSLSQHWYVAGSGGNLQTAEVGWQVYPAKYGHTKPVFFIYWTADDYNQTGCYNLDCSAFVQTNRSWAIGGSLSPWSTSGGQQYEIQVAFYLYQGNWWLYVGGTDAAHAIGYYPKSIYKNGAMTSNATEIDYGGEVVGTTSWPPMGSGAFAKDGWQRACYQRDIYYYPTAGGAKYATLTGSQASPGCFTVDVVNYNPPWNETIFFGGPGGSSC